MERNLSLLFLFDDVALCFWAFLTVKETVLYVKEKQNKQVHGWTVASPEVKEKYSTKAKFTELLGPKAKLVQVISHLNPSVRTSEQTS